MAPQCGDLIPDRRHMYGDLPLADGPAATVLIGVAGNHGPSPGPTIWGWAVSRSPTET